MVLRGIPSLLITITPLTFLLACHITLGLTNPTIQKINSKKNGQQMVVIILVTLSSLSLTKCLTSLRKLFLPLLFLLSSVCERLVYRSSLLGPDIISFVNSKKAAKSVFNENLCFLFYLLLTFCYQRFPEYTVQIKYLHRNRF